MMRLFLIDNKKLAQSNYRVFISNVSLRFVTDRTGFSLQMIIYTSCNIVVVTKKAHVDSPPSF